MQHQNNFNTLGCDLIVISLVVVSFAWWGCLQNFRPLGSSFLVEVEFLWWGVGGSVRLSCGWSSYCAVIPFTQFGSSLYQTIPVWYSHVYTWLWLLQILAALNDNLYRKQPTSRRILSLFVNALWEKNNNTWWIALLNSKPKMVEYLVLSSKYYAS